jgi:putative DNA primase/helicase
MSIINDRDAFVQEMLGYYDAGVRFVPIPKGKKIPNFPNWNVVCAGWSREQFEYYLKQDFNWGILPGNGGMVDIDLDWDTARDLAPQFLPPTKSYGRKSSRRSHYPYKVSGEVKTRQFVSKLRYPDEEKAMICEYRANGHSIFPGSVHPSGELIEWENSDVSIAEVNAEELFRSVQLLAAASIISKAYPDGRSNRHDIALALSGGMLRNGYSEDEVEKVIFAVAEYRKDEEASSRLSDVRTTSARIDAGETVTGFPKLVELIGKDPVDSLCKALGVKERKAVEHIKDSDGLPMDSPIAVKQYLAELARPEVRYCPETGTYYAWNKIYWQEDLALVGINRVYDQMIKDWYRKAAESTDSSERDRYKALCFKFDYPAMRSSVIASMKSVESLHVRRDDFDRDRHLFNAPNCVINLLTLETFEEHDPDLLMTMVGGCDYKPELAGKAERFEKFMWEITTTEDKKDRSDVRQSLMRWSGYGATGDVRFEYFSIFYGDGANGKSKLCDLLADIYGTYSCKIMPEALLSSRNKSTGIEYLREIAATRGKRFVYTSEPDDSDGSRWNMDVIKRLAGDGKVIGRPFGQKREEWDSMCKLIISLNTKPDIPDQTSGTKRRFLMFPFERQFMIDDIPTPDCDLHVNEKLAAEREAVFATLILEAHYALTEDVLPIAEDSRKEVKEYFADEDPINAFFDNCVSYEWGTHVSRPELFASYEEWCRNNKDKARKPLKKLAFYKIIRKRSNEVKPIEEDKIGGLDCFLHIRLKSAGRQDPFSDMKPKAQAKTSVNIEEMRKIFGDDELEEILVGNSGDLIGGLGK